MDFAFFVKHFLETPIFDFTVKTQIGKDNLNLTKIIYVTFVQNDFQIRSLIEQW